MSWRGVFSGALALIALEVVLTTDNAANRFGKLLTWVGDGVRLALSPAVAAIPNFAGASQPGTAHKAGGAGTPGYPTQ